MSAYKFNDPNGIYFVTFTVVEWIDVFTRQEYKSIVLDSLQFWKGLTNEIKSELKHFIYFKQVRASVITH